MMIRALTLTKEVDFSLIKCYVCYRTENLGLTILVTLINEKP